MTLRGKVAVVTGAASGMGRALCRELAQEGVRLELLDRNAEGLASLEAELRQLGAPYSQSIADVSDHQAVRPCALHFASCRGSFHLARARLLHRRRAASRLNQLNKLWRLP